MAQGRQHGGCGARGGAQGPAPPLTDLSLCLLLPHPREILGLVDVVALENGELGPLLSAGTLRGLEDECVTDVKVPSKVATRNGEVAQSVRDCSCRGQGFGSQHAHGSP